MRTRSNKILLLGVCLAEVDQELRRTLGIFLFLIRRFFLLLVLALSIVQDY